MGEDIRAVLSQVEPAALDKIKAALENIRNAPPAADAPSPPEDAPKSEEAPKLTEEQLENVRKTFDTIDVDKSGTIELQELVTALKALKPDFSDEQCQAVFDSMDLDKNKKVDFDEYTQMVTESLAKSNK